MPSNSSNLSQRSGPASSASQWSYRSSYKVHDEIWVWYEDNRTDLEPEALSSDLTTCFVCNDSTWSDGKANDRSRFTQRKRSLQKSKGGRRATHLYCIHGLWWNTEDAVAEFRRRSSATNGSSNHTTTANADVPSSII